MVQRIVDPLNSNEWINLSEGVEYLPVRRNLVANLGLFQPEFLETNTAIIPITTVSDYLMVDIPWGTRVKNTQRDANSRLRIEVPHFAVEDAVRPLDIAGKVNSDDFMLQTRSETVQSFLDKKQVSARQTVMNTWAEAFMHLIREGSAYAPNGTVINNYYTAFGVTRSDVTITLGQASNPKPSIQAAIDNITDNFKGGYVPSRYLAIAGQDFFDAMTQNAFIMNTAQIYKDERQSAEILTGILGTEGYDLSARYQVLDFGGVIWIRASASEMPTNEARMFPTDLPDLFKVFFAPSDLTFDTIHSPAQAEYYFEKMEPDRTALNFSYESNFLVATLWPKAIIRLVADYS